ncbi:MAG: outer membrane lipoprotein-sorting protein [Gammaproteobacteria bacterium]|nr:outer membrane lipoprotein-sorting protein [Gammaproteobacteria bacterium]
MKTLKTLTRGIAAILPAAALLTALPVSAQNYSSGQAVMQASYEQSRQHKNQRASVELLIKNREGKTRVREFRMWHKIFPERTKSLMKFDRPPSVKNTGLLSETLDGADIADQWIYLPALRSVKQLNADDQNKSFVGSDFTNGDIAGRQVSRDKHRIVRQDSKKIHIESIPRDRSDLYSKLEVEMLRKVLVPASITFYDRGGKKLKTLTNNRIRKVKGMYMVIEAEMTNHQSGGSTKMTKSDIDLDRVIEEDRVGIKGLRR